MDVARSNAIWIAAIAACITTCAAAAPISYVVHSTVGAAMVDGIVTTDGRLGVLAADDFLSFDLTLRIGAATGVIDSGAGAIVNVGGAGTIATPSTLSFQFSAFKDGTFLRFTSQDFLSVWCLGGICSQFPVPGEFVVLPDQSAGALRPSVTEVLGTVPRAVPEPGDGLLAVGALFAAAMTARKRRRPPDGMGRRDRPLRSQRCSRPIARPWTECWPGRHVSST